VAAHDVCLGAFGTGPKAQRVVPTKVYQGLAAGCAVVTGDTPAVGALGAAVLRVPPGDAAALAALLRQLTTDQEALTMARRRARDAAARYTPGAVTASLAERLARVPASQPTPPPLTFNAWLRWDLIASELEALPAGDVLEIGPGEGAAACRLAVGRAYTGVELSDRTRAITEQRLAAQGTPGRLLASLDDLAPDEQFDLVCAFEVIEHIEHDAAALAAWAARVRPGGALILSTPAGPDRMGAADQIAGHFRRYDPELLAAMARAVGLVEVRVRHVGFPFGYGLEAVRNAVAARRLAGQAATAAAAPDEALAEFTEGSSSFLQPPAWSGPATRLASAPGRWMQRRFPDRGPGLVLVARAR
jgi:2-polyprenyl-3-methyl-5-hydroxy-6-metoxy-1,4-benzoquinol methylase